MTLVARVAGMLLAMLFCGQVNAQSDSPLTPHLEHEKRLRAAEQVEPLKSDLFGDSVSLYNGATEFAVTDIDLPGNNGLPVQLRRRFRVESFKEVVPLGGFGNWDLDVPHLSGTFDGQYKWNTAASGSTARCSSLWYPRTSAPFEITDIWAGTHMHLPGGGGGELLYLPSSGSAVPSDGGNYIWGTSSLHRFKCTPTTANGYPGEGFIAIDTSGNRYFFDVGIERGAGVMQDSSGVRRGRAKVYLMASRVEDRHGNWVAYQYTGDRLTGISSSDGRAITLTYSGNQIVKATAHGREWTYAYTSDISALGMRRVPLLSQVTQPDTSKWGYQYGLANSGQGGLNPFYLRWDGASHLCEPPPFHPNSFSLEVAHPSGAKGVFAFEYMRQYRSGTPASACHARGDGNYALGIPDHFDLYALTRKTITGPGLPSSQWQYSYSGAGGRTTLPYPCMSCPGEKTVVVSQPDGSSHLHVFGNRYYHNTGRLLGTSIRSASGALLRSESNTYVTDAEAASAPFPNMHGGSLSTDDGATTFIRPVKRTAIMQDGVTFSSVVNSFDAFARPLSVTKSSTLPGSPSRTESTAYSDHLSKWVLGQVAKVTCTMSTPSHTACDGGTDSVMSEASYDSLARPTQFKSFGKIVQTLTYNADGTVATVKDGNNNVTTLTSWKRGIPQGIKHPATPEATSGATESAVVDNNGWITSVTDETGSKTCYEYDPTGRVKKIIYPTQAANTCDTGQSLWNSTTIDFSSGHPAAYGMPAGHWRQTTRTGNGRKVVIFDALWRPVVEQTLDLGNVIGTVSEVIYRYDSQGRTIFRSYPTGTNGAAVYSDPALKGTHTTYDALGRVTQVRQDWEETGQLTTTTEYLSSADGYYTRTRNPRGYYTWVRYQAFDQPNYDTPVFIQRHSSGGVGYAITEIDRDVFGKPKSITRRKGDDTQSATRSYTYNVNQELCRAVEPETGATLMGYDGAGNLTWSASGLPASTACHATGNTAAINARKAVRTYDARHRLKTLTFPGDGLGNQTWTYTPDGLPATVTTRNDTGGAQQAINSYTYNRRRLLTRETLQFGTVFTWPVNYAYNSNGHLASLTWHGLAVNYAPNALGQPTQAGTYATGVKYHPNGGIREFTYGNGIKHTLTQNARGLPDTSCDFYGSCNASAVLNDGYDYDQNGNVAAISDGRTGNRGNRTMDYDPLDRLVTTTSPMFGTATYTYDALDNLTRVKLTGGNQVRDHWYCYDTATWRLTNVKTGSCSGATVVGLGYDVQGNLANKSGRTYAFDFGNRLRSSSGSPGSSYAYDGHGRRVLDQVGTGRKYSHYLQDGRLSMTGDDRAGKVAEYVYLQGSLLAIRERDVPTGVYTTKYQHTDALGSPVAVTNESRTVLERTEYEPYGRPANRVGRDGPGYTGHVEDAATGLVQMQQRYYDPMLGIFLSVDPITAMSNPVGMFNRYRYAANNPYSYFDPDGRECEKVTGSRICGGGAGNNVSVTQVNPSSSGNRSPSRSEMQSRPVASSNPEDYDHSDPTFHKYDFGSSLCVEGPGCSVKDLAPTVAPDSAPRFGSVDQGYNVLHLNNPIIHTSFFAEDGSFYMINATTSAHDFHAGAVVSRLYSAGGFVNLHTSGFGYSSNFATKMANFAVGYAYFGAWQINLSGAAKISSGQMRPPK